MRPSIAMAARALRHGAWQTRVGRRITLLFVASALVPVTALGAGAYWAVGGSLARTAREQAQASARRTGIMISDRLDWAERELRVVAGGLDPREPPPSRLPDRSARYWLDAVMLTAPGEPSRPLRGSRFAVPALTRRQAAHLEEGATALTLSPDDAAILFARADPASAGTMWGRMSPHVLGDLLAAELTARDGNVVCILSLSGGTVVACHPDDPGGPLGPALGETALGTFEWSDGAEAHVAGFWSLFLDYRYAAPDWRIVYSHARGVALAPLARFRQTYLLVAVLTVLAVALLSTVQIRRSLAPLRALHEGTERVGRREFDRPVELRSGDEFEDLARSFNDMTRRLKTQFSEVERLAVALKGVSDELRGREAQLRGVLESAADGIVAVGARGEIRAFNQAAERLFGYSRADVDGRRFAEFFAVPLGDGPAGLPAPGAVGNPSMEVVARRRDGSTFPTELTFGRMEAAGAVRYTVFVRDIADRKRAAEEQARLEAQLRHAQKMETIGTLAGGIAHDFNNILMPIMGHLELAMETIGPSSDLLVDLEPIRDAAGRARDLVKRILTFSRSTEQAFGPVDLGRVVSEAMQLLRSSIPTTIAIRAHVAPDVGSVDGDGTQLHQVLMNLCMNAYHAMRERGGRLEIDVSLATPEPGLAALHPSLAADPCVRLTVRDTGHGMDRATLERVFEPFFTTKPAGEGTGLGMAIVHGIVTAHGGAITVESEPGVGTAFSIYLPPGGATVGGAAATQPRAMPRGHGRVLVVDDDEVVARLVGRALERVGYHASCAAHPAEALERMQAGDRFDLLITDQTMPGMTGVQLAERVRAGRPGFPVILMTGYSELSRESIEGLGISELLVKPVEIERLAATVARVLQASRANGLPAAGVGDGG